MDKKFKCKELEWLEEGSSIDFLGVDVSMTRGYVGMSMPRYVTKFLELMNHGGAPSRVPLAKPITHSEPLSPEQATRFRAGVGCLNWMAHTVRPDLSYAHSRLSQHLHNPTEAAWQGLMQACSYLQGTIQLGLRSPRWSLVPSSTDTRQVGRSSTHGSSFVTLTMREMMKCRTSASLSGEVLRY